MERAVWQDHLVSVSKLFVEHTRLFMLRKGLKTEGPNGVARSDTSSETKILDSCDIESEGET